MLAIEHKAEDTENSFGTEQPAQVESLTKTRRQRVASAKAGGGGMDDEIPFAPCR
jgi:hypothetical protein